MFGYIGVYILVKLKTPRKQLTIQGLSFGLSYFNKTGVVHGLSKICIMVVISCACDLPVQNTAVLHHGMYVYMRSSLCSEYVFWEKPLFMILFLSHLYEHLQEHL